MGKRLKQYWQSIDSLYLILCICLSVLSIITLFSVAQYGGINYGGTFGNYKPAYTQIFATAIGIVGAIILSLIDYRHWLAAWPIHASICWGLVLLTFVPGIGYAPGATGSQSWISLPLGLSFQPTEIAKISFILTLSTHIDKIDAKVNQPRHLIWLILHIAIPVLLIHFQGDDGTAMSFLAIGVVMLVMAGLNRWAVGICSGAVLLSVPLLWQYVISPHQKQRIIGLVNFEQFADGIMYQQLCGRSAIKNGGLFGIGWFSPVHSYVPRSENDFIFSYFAECCGFIGCVVLLSVLFSLLFKSLSNSAKCGERRATYICIGMFSVLLFQIIINLGMNVMLLPVMGLTLPFVSAGGSSTFMLYLLVGITLSTGRFSGTNFAIKRRLFVK